MNRYTDLYPATVISSIPEDSRLVAIPKGVKVRALITDQYLTIGWLYGSAVQRIDIPLTEGDVGEDVTYSGGTVLGITISRAGACSTCGGGRKMLSWQPFPGEAFTEVPRKETEIAQRVAAGRQMTGLIPVRYSRTR